MNATTSVPARKATAKTSPSTSGKAAHAIEGVALTWQDAAIEARDAVAKLVLEARGIDENEREDLRGQAKQLMQMLVADLGETSSDAEQAVFETAFFNAEALIHGMFGMPNEKVGPKTEANLRHALTIVDAMTDVLSGGYGIEKVMAVIAKEPQPVAPEVASIASEDHANSVTPGIELLKQGERRWNSAVYLLRACLDTYTEDINYAADSLADLAWKQLSKATDENDFQAADEAHAEMWRTAAVVQYRMCDNECGGEEMFALEGIHSLMTQAMKLVTDALAKSHEGGAA